jgi:phosphoribosyl 1,2-cyclic phosphodiesterase
VEPPSFVLVDAFRHSSEPCQFWFLSHFHADHYQGLQSEWTAGVIHCSTITANLVVKIIGVDPSFVRALPFDQVGRNLNRKL